MRFKKTALCALPLVLVPAAALLPSAMASAATSPLWALRLNAGGPAYTDAAGQAWSADQYYVGGTTASFTSTAANTPDPALYQTERSGMRGHTPPLPTPGLYRVPPRRSESRAPAAGKRVFSVTAEGQTVVSNLDLVKTIGANTAY